MIKNTDKAVCVETWQGGVVWLPLKCVHPNYKYTKGIAYIIPQWLVEEKKLDGKEFQPYHKPARIEPVYNQVAIDEIKL